MHKKKLLTLLLSVSLLGACNTDDSDTTENSAAETEELDTIEEEAALDDDPDEAVVTDEELSPVSDEEFEQAEAIDDLDQYEEFSEQSVFDPSEHDAYLVTDNGNTRVIIFHDGSQQVFKSIFIIEESRLKIIDLLNNELLLNSPL